MGQIPKTLDFAVVSQDTKSTRNKRKINKRKFIKIKSFLHQRYYQESKMTPHKWEKIHANRVSDQGPVSGMYEGFLQLSNKTNANLTPG